MTRSADVLIPIYRDVPITVACIESVLAHTGAELGRLILVNDGSPEAEMKPALERLAARDRRIVLLENERNLGFIHSCNRGLLIRQRDVVLLNSDTRVTAGWLQELIAVAHSTDRASCVVPLSNNATICSVPLFVAESPAQEIDAASLRLEDWGIRSTILPTGVGFCLLLKDHVLNMVGPLDPDYGRGYNEENDWVMRAQRLGFIPLRANRAFVYHLGSISFGEERNHLEAANARLLSQRHPHYLPQVQEFLKGSEGPAAAHYVAHRMGKHSVCLDMRHVHAQRQTAASHPTVRPSTHSSWHAISAARPISRFLPWWRPKSKKRLVEHFGIPACGQSDLANVQVLHRPAQVFNPKDLQVLLDSPAHLVITYQDLIAYRVPAVFDHFADHERYRATSHSILHSSQAVIAISDHNRQELVSEFHLDPERVTTIYHGVDEERFGRREETANFGQLRELAVEGPFFLYAGVDFPHKNLPLLLRAYALFRSQLKDRAVPELLLVGPSWLERGIYLGSPRTMQPGVRYLGPVSDQALTALMQEALGFTYLSSYEGFGLPVLEAMAAGTPVICSTLSSLPEVAGDAVLAVKSFAAEEIASHLQTLLHDASVRRRLIKRGHERVKQFTWQQTAKATQDVYLEVIRKPSPAAFAHRRAFASILTYLNRN